MVVPRPVDCRPLEERRQYRRLQEASVRRLAAVAGILAEEGILQQLGSRPAVADRSLVVVDHILVEVAAHTALGEAVRIGLAVRKVLVVHIGPEVVEHMVLVAHTGPEVAVHTVLEVVVREVVVRKLLVAHTVPGEVAHIVAVGHKQARLELCLALLPMHPLHPCRRMSDRSHPS